MAKDDCRPKGGLPIMCILFELLFISKDKLQLNNRNVTLEICLQSMDRTLNDEDINKSIQSITTDIKKLYKLNIQEA